MAGTAIEARGLSKQFILRHNRGLSLKSRVVGVLNKRQRETLEPFWALRDVSLSIGRGERVGLIGRNGSGKSTLLKLIAGIHRPTSGQLLIARNATIGTMIELGVGFHPDLTGTENVFLNAAIHGRSREQIEALYPKVVEYSGLGRFMDVALKNYSSGMHMRLGFAIAANLDPDVILLDEVFAVGDDDFQKKCMSTMERFAAEGRTIVFVSHAMVAVRQMCRRVCVLDAGQLQFDGNTESGIAAYEKLLSPPAAAAPSPDDTLGPPEPGDRTTVARRHGIDWLLSVIERERPLKNYRVLEIGVTSVPDALSPVLEHAGPDRYSYWQAGTADIPDVRLVDIAAAPTIFMHFPLNVVARIISTTLQRLPPGGRFYASVFEVPAAQAFEAKAWPSGIVTSADALPYHYSFDMMRALASAFGATLERVSDASYPTGETVVVFVR